MDPGEDRKSGFFDPRLETFTPSERSAYLDEALVRIVRHAYASAPAIRKKFDACGLTPGDMRAVSDLARLPVTHKHELSALQQENPPFGGFLGVPLEKLKRICMSPGPIYEPEGIDGADDRWAQAIFAAGFRKGDICQVTFSYHLVPPAFWFEHALTRLGCVITPGGVGNTDLQLRMMRDLKVAGYIGTPSFLAALRQKALEAGLDPGTDLNLRAGFVTGERLPESLRGELEAAFRMTIRQGYGTADVGCLGFECGMKDGMHVPADCIVEIVDPETGAPLGAGEPGEIVATVFDPVYPMIRFGTGDLSTFTDAPCPCGRTGPRLGKLLGRIDQVTKVKGMFIHPAGVAEVAARFPEIGRFQMVVTREGHSDRMTLMAELREDAAASPDLEKKIEAAIPEVLRVRGKAVILKRGGLSENAPPIEDRRSWS
jgi:phenylacetate-CoA ligase